MGIKRAIYSESITIANGGNLSAAIDMREFAGGMLHIPAALEATTVIGFKVCPTKDGTFVPLRKNDGTKTLDYIETQLNEAGAYPLLDGLFGGFFVKIYLMTTAGVAVNQTADRAFTVTLKG